MSWLHSRGIVSSILTSYNTYAPFELISGGERLQLGLEESQVQPLGLRELASHLRLNLVHFGEVALANAIVLFEPGPGRRVVLQFTVVSGDSSLKDST